MNNITTTGARKVIRGAVAGLAISLFTSVVYAMPILDVSGVDVTDVHFTILPNLPEQPGVDKDADEAFGYTGNDDVNDINAIPWDPIYGTGDFLLLDKTNSAPNEYMGVTFNISSPTDSNDPNYGNWVLDWAETADPGLPLYMDFVFVTKASTAFGAYLFDNVLFTANPDTGNGTFVISWMNNGGNTPDLSHGSFYARSAGDPPIDPDPKPVPVPGTLLLLGLGLIVMARLRRQVAKAQVDKNASVSYREIGSIQ